jgi:hypothetical protein
MLRRVVLAVVSTCTLVVALTATDASAQVTTNPKQVSIESKIVGVRSGFLSEIGVGLEGGFATGGGNGTVVPIFAPSVTGPLGGTDGIIRLDVRTSLISFPFLTSASPAGTGLKAPPRLIGGVKVGLSDQASDTFVRQVAPGVTTTLRAEQKVIATPYLGLALDLAPQVLPNGTVGLQIMPFLGVDFWRQTLTMTVDDGVLNVFQNSRNQARLTGGFEASLVMPQWANSVTPVIGGLMQVRQRGAVSVDGRTISGFNFSGNRDEKTELVVLITPRLVFRPE